MSAPPQHFATLTGHICPSQFSLSINSAVKQLSRLHQLDLRYRSHHEAPLLSFHVSCLFRRSRKTMNIFVTKKKRILELVVLSK